MIFLSAVLIETPFSLHMLLNLKKKVHTLATWDHSKPIGGKGDPPPAREPCGVKLHPPLPPTKYHPIRLCSDTLPLELGSLMYCTCDDTPTTEIEIGSNNFSVIPTQ